MILLTGGTGLVGSHLLVRLASQGRQIRAIKRIGSDISIVPKLLNHYGIPKEYTKHIEWVDAEVNDYPSLKSALLGIDEVYHCAAVVSFRSSDFRKMLEANVQGTANLVDACIETGVKRFCFVSSIAALGSPENGKEVDENSAWGKTKGKSGYAVSKFFSEMEVWRGIELGLNATIVNPSVIIGPGKWDRGSGQLFATVAKGFPFYTNGVTGYVDVRDVVEAMVIAMEKELWGKRFLLNGQNLSARDLFSLIAYEMGKKPPSIEVKQWMSGVAWRLAWLGSLFIGKTPALTRQTAQSAHNVTYYSSKLSEEKLGISFRLVSEAIANTVKAGRL